MSTVYRQYDFANEIILQIRHFHSSAKGRVMLNFRIIVSSIMIIGILCGTASAESLDHAVKDTVDQLCRYLKSKQHSRISVGQFIGPPQLTATSGPGIVHLFHTYFKQQGIEVATRAEVGLKGEYSLARLPDDGVGVKIRGSLVDAYGDVLTDFHFSAHDYAHDKPHDKHTKPGGKYDPPKAEYRKPGGEYGQPGDQYKQPDGEYNKKPVYTPDPHKPDGSSYAEKHVPGTYERVIDKHEDIASLLGATTEIYAQDKHIDRNRDYKKHLLDPRLYIDGSKCAPNEHCPYQIEILVHGHPLPIRLHDGLGHVSIKHGDIYAVRIYNKSPYDAAVRLSVDGLNVFTFSQLRKHDGSPKYEFYIVPAHKTVTLKGWHRSNSTVDSFLVTDYAKSAAATIQHQHELGTITAVFSAAWPKGGQKPHDEDFTGKGGGKATGFGPPVAQQVNEVHREVGRMRAAISLRYDK